jgi:hypothetical protein
MVDPRPITLTSGTNPNPAFTPEPVIVVGGLPTKTQVAALTNIATADATDLPTAIALANATKAKVNQIIAALKA